MIGAKTLATLTLLAVELAAALGLGILSPSRLATRGWGTLFVVGSFGVVVGTLMFRFWRLGERSAHYFRWANEATPWERSESHFLGGERRRITLGENNGDAYDLPPPASHALCVAIALLLALACIDARAVELLDRFQNSVGQAGAGYCPDPAAQPPPAQDPNVPGCELIRRAYALGYAESLGDCAPKKAEATAGPVCTRRQRGEPVLHYSWRLLDGFWSKLRAQAGSSYFGGLGRDFHQRVGHLSSLRSAERQVLASAPHAAHHIWTNLPDPGNDGFWAKKCGDRYLKLGHRPNPTLPGQKGASQVFEHVLAQLVFEASYEPAAGNCREFHVHWGAPIDACPRLAAQPQKVLADSGALSSVDEVLDRYRVERELATLNNSPQPIDPTAVISFSCYMESDKPARTTMPLSFAGHSFSIVEVRVAPSAGALYVDRYDAVAQLLVDGFHYGRLLSAAGIEQGAATGLQAAFSGHDYLLTRLYGLDSVDLYLDPGWIAARPDLLEVYPYQRHLKNYVQTFRRQYRGERGRL
jgi:hypothetical protein